MRPRSGASLFGRDGILPSAVRKRLLDLVGDGNGKVHYYVFMLQRFLL
jgi:hypothetical protein